MQTVLQTGRLTLRPLTLSDLDTVHVYASDPELTRYMIYLPNETREETRAFLTQVSEEWQKENPSFFEFAIVLDGTQIGAVSIYLNEDRTEGELGWILIRDYHKKGYATEAALAVKEFVVHRLQVKKLIAHCDCKNRPSCRLMEKLGLTLEDDTGTRIYPKTGQTARELMYSLTL